MGKIVTWSTQAYSASLILDQTDSLLYLENVVRQRQMVSPFSIKFCLEGAIPYVVNREKISVHPGHFMLVNEGLEMECVPCQPGVKALVFYFTRALLCDVYRNRCTPEIRLLDRPEQDPESFHFFQAIYRPDSKLLQTFQALSSQMTKSGEARSGLEPDAFYQLADHLLMLQVDVGRQINRLNARRAVTREELFRRIMKARDFMQGSWQSDLSLNEIARQACLSPFHFHRSFQEVFGISPMKWLRQIKLQYARSLLISGQWTVTQVALKCGFADVFSFSKAYKKTWGVSPSKIPETHPV